MASAFSSNLPASGGTSVMARCKAHVLRDIKTPVQVPLSTLGYRDFTANADWKRNLISTTSVMWHPGRKRVICGLTSFDTDILYEFDPVTSTFESLDYGSISEPFEIKIHRSLALENDGSILGATACLHREDQRSQAPGGRIFRYDFNRRQYEDLGRPVPPEYVQSIDIDTDRQLLYGFTYPVFYFFVYDLKLKKVRRTEYVGSTPHRTAVDRNGCVWGTWSNRTHHLFKYDPDKDQMTYFDHGLPGSTSKNGLMFPGQGPIDMLIDGPDGLIYFGQLNGELVRMDPDTAVCQTLGCPVSGKTRLPALTVGPDGNLYGVNGFMDGCHLFKFNTRNSQFTDLGIIQDSKSGEQLFIGHDMTFTDDGTLFIGETDTTHRAGYLWECHLSAD